MQIRWIRKHAWPVMLGAAAMCSAGLVLGNEAAAAPAPAAVPQEDTKAEEWWKKADSPLPYMQPDEIQQLEAYIGQDNVAKKLLIKGIRYMNGMGEPFDPVKAVECFQESAKIEHGDLLVSHSVASCFLGWCYDYGLGVEKDSEKALEHWENAALLGHFESICCVGMCYALGLGVDKIESIAMYKLLESLPGRNFVPYAECFAKGVALEYGFSHPQLNESGEQDEQAAARVYRAPNLNWPAMVQRMMLNAALILSSRHSTLIEQAKLHGIALGGVLPKVQMKLAHNYANGIIVKKNDKEAVRWYSCAAENGNPVAQLILADRYENGRGVKKNAEVAAAWYNKAAAQGFDWAQVNRTLCQQYGGGIENNEDKAVGVFRNKAEQGDAQEQFNLGLCHERGIGVEENEEKAVVWYRKVAVQGYAVAQTNLANLLKNKEMKVTEVRG